MSVKGNFSPFGKLATQSPLIMGASIGNCVHIAGVANFLRIAESFGIRTVLLGAAIPPSKLIEAIDKVHPTVVGVSYRLTAEIGSKFMNEFLDLLGNRSPILLFGGTPRMAAVAKKTGRFKYIFIGDESFAQIEEILKMIQGNNTKNEPPAHLTQLEKSASLTTRLQHLIKIDGDGHFIPMLRHHFGLPSLEKTIEGVKDIADSETLDIISIAPDQNAQQFFFQPNQIDPKLNGAGGVPIREGKDLRRIKKAAQRGNFPLLRIYSGTQDLQKWAELSVKELGNAWGAIPIFWYSQLDGRSNRKLERAISENQAVIKWYAEQSLPVEVLEAHQWSLREAPDSVAVAAGYIGAYNAKSLGVKHFLSQFMFNTPRFTSPLHDLAKMTALYLMVASLCSDSFIQWRQVRPGLSHFSSDQDIAKGQLATTLSFSLGLRPHIIHVVSYTEADHAANAEEVIKSCKIVIGALKNTFLGIPDPLKDGKISEKRVGIIEEACWLIGTIENLGKYLGARDPFTDPKTLSTAVEIGILDAPHLKGQPYALGYTETRPVEGGCRAINKSTGKPLPERERLNEVLRTSKAKEIIGPDAHKLISYWSPPDQVECSDFKLIE